ncbi:MAG: hypothetical protein QT08_C0019G0027 [archaeon GW2011_AR17]|nr:MAG: hypothetical protein QT08_C0019G0027 [archaeon GW2011_AR17]
MVRLQPSEKKFLILIPERKAKILGLKKDMEFDVDSDFSENIIYKPIKN